MTTNIQEAGVRLGAAVRSEHVAREWHAIHIWSGIGAFWMVIIIYVFAAWFLSGNVHATLTGVTPVPESIKINAIFWQAFLGALSVILFYVFVIQGWRREGRLTLYGMLYIASQTMWWQDALLNYFSPIFSYNSILVNWGSWNASVPGWVSPNAEKMPSPVLLYLGLYPIFFCGATILVVTLLKKAKARWPQMGNMTLISIMFVALGIFAVLAEGMWLRTGMYTYTGLASPVTLWPGESYKVPVLSVFVLDSMVLTLLACLIYFRDDRGQTRVERGVEQLRVGRALSTTMRCLAIIGAANSILFVAYNIPMNYLALKGPGWAPSVLEKSYFTNGVCGDGSDYACPGGSVPVPIGVHQIHLGPDGSVVVPQGADLPRLIKSKTE
jgi:Spirocyclase AveC-like